MGVEEGKKIYINGKIVDFHSDEAKIHIITQGLHYGIGAFEGIRAYSTSRGTAAIFRIGDHIERLFESCDILGIKVPYSRHEVGRAIVDTVKANGYPECYIRPVVFADFGVMGFQKLSPITFAVAAWPWGTYLGKDGVEKGIRLKISSYRRIPGALPWKAKACGNYISTWLAKQEALNAGYDEAIFLDDRGMVAEASAANLFIVKKSRVITPPLSAPILAGITRDTVIQIVKHMQGFARQLDYTVAEEEFTREQLYAADECFLCGTAAEVTPVREIDGRTIGKGAVGPVTKEIQQYYFNLVRGIFNTSDLSVARIRKTAQKEKWFTYI